MAIETSSAVQIVSLSHNPKDYFDKGNRYGRLFTYSGLLLLSGSLQRPIGGELEGNFLLSDGQSNNNLLIYLGALVYTLSAILLIERKGRISFAPPHLTIAALVTLALCSTIWSGAPAATLFRSASLAGSTLFILMACTYEGIDRTIQAIARFFMFWIVVSFIISIALPSYSFHNSNDYYSVHSGLYKGFYHHKNAFSMTASLAIVFLCLSPSQLVRRGIIFYSCVAACAYLVIVSGSAKVAFSIPIAVIAAFVIPKLSSARRLALIAFSIFIIVLFNATNLTDLLSREMLSLVGRDPTLTARTDIWSTVIDFTLRSNPIIGGGYGGGAWASGLQEAVTSQVGSDPGHSHNGFIQLYAELGLLGLLLAAALFISLLARTIKSKGKESPYLRLAVGIISVVFVNNLAGSALLESAGLYWSMLCVVPLILYRTKRAR